QKKCHGKSRYSRLCIFNKWMCSMKNLNKRGIALLAVFLMLMGLMLILQISFVNISFWQDVSIQKATYMQHYRMAQILLHEGIATVVKKRAIISGEYEKRFTNLPVKGSSRLKGLVTIKEAANNYTIESCLTLDRHKIMSLCCDLIEEKD